MLFMDVHIHMNLIEAVVFREKDNGMEMSREIDGTSNFLYSSLA